MKYTNTIQRNKTLYPNLDLKFYSNKLSPNTDQCIVQVT